MDRQKYLGKVWAGLCARVETHLNSTQTRGKRFRGYNPVSMSFTAYRYDMIEPLTLCVKWLGYNSFFWVLGTDLRAGKRLVIRKDN